VRKVQSWLAAVGRMRSSTASVCSRTSKVVGTFQALPRNSRQRFLINKLTVRKVDLKHEHTKSKRSREHRAAASYHAHSLDRDGHEYSDLLRIYVFCEATPGAGPKSHTVAWFSHSRRFHTFDLVRDQKHVVKEGHATTASTAGSASIHSSLGHHGGRRTAGDARFFCDGESLLLRPVHHFRARNVVPLSTSRRGTKCRL